MLSERIGAFVRGEGDDSFDGLVGEAFRLHFEKSPAVRRLAEAAGVTPATLDDWRQVPLVPTLAFKMQKLSIDEPEEVFHGSGTTDSSPSVHQHPYPELCREVIDATFPAALLAQLDRPPMLSLIPAHADAPHSSLAFMIDHVLERWGGEGSRTVVGRRGLNTQELRGFLAARQRDRRPAVILATALALVHLVEALERLQLSFRLPAGSRVFETGGYKGKSRELSRQEVSATLEGRLGVRPTMVVHEYGVTELTCHVYSAPRAGDAECFKTPPWVRFRVLRPDTLDEAPAGEIGLLAVFDLANVGSALHVVTEDLAVAESDGFSLAGRAAGAEVRRCSLLSEELAG